MNYICYNTFIMSEFKLSAIISQFNILNVKLDIYIFLRFIFIMIPCEWCRLGLNRKPISIFFLLDFHLERERRREMPLCVGATKSRFMAGRPAFSRLGKQQLCNAVLSSITINLSGKPVLEKLRTPTLRYSCRINREWSRKQNDSSNQLF